MLEAVKPRPARLILFTHRFMPSVGPLEAPVRWWFKISVRQRSSVSPSERISATSSLLHPTMALRGASGFARVVGQVDVTHRLLGQPAPRSSSWGSPRRSPSSMRSWPRSSSRSEPESKSLRIR